MFKRKQDVDKHVAAILSRRRDEKEKQSQGFQIARLYADIKEYGVAKRYLSGFLHVRENVPQAHQLMGEINEGLGEKDEAIENYKRALNLGSYGSSNKQLVLKICELYCDQGTDVERMKYWCEQCEKFYPKSDIVFKLKTQIAEASSGQQAENGKEMENLVVSELLNHPTDLKLRIKLLNLYIDSDRYDEAYDSAISTDLTTAFIDRLPWFEFLQTLFQRYSEKFPHSNTDLVYNQHYLHILRNVTYLSMGGREVNECVQNLQRFDQQLKIAVSLSSQEEEWLAILQELKGQMFFLAGLLLLKRAQTGSIGWQEINHLCGACFLASRSIDPIDPQAPWFVSSPQSHSKFYNWWFLQSYDRLSQVGHMLQQLSQDDFTEWSRNVRQSMMTSKGRNSVFSVLYAPRDVKAQGEVSFLYQAREMVESSDSKEPVTVRHMIDIDRVAHQVHISSLPHLVWLCLQRYSLDMNAQPNYHFNLMENIQYSTKNMDTGAGESLCQLDILVFLLATVQCSASALAEKSMLMYDENKGRPSLLPICLSKPLCTHEQEEWWSAAYKFCTNSVKDDFSRLRRVLVRGIETVRLIGPHGVSVSLVAHIARSLDAKAKSLRQAEYGSRLPPQDLAALESRAVFYWEKAKQALQKLQRNHHGPIPKSRLFKEPGDMDISSRLIDKYLAEAVFALSVAAMRDGQYETALEGFEAHRSVWAKFYCAQILKSLANRESDKDDITEVETSRKQALVFKARDYLFDVMDMLNGDKSHELNGLVSRELDDLQMKIHDMELVSARNSPFLTPAKSAGPGKCSSATNGVSYSTPKNVRVSSWFHSSNGSSEGESNADINHSPRDHSVACDSHARPRPSPERLDLQIKSLSYSQASLFKIVMDRNEELIMINGKMMEELRDNNNQLKNVLAENKSLMEELKTFLGDNRDMMKQIKTELSSLKPSLIPPAPAQVSPATPLFVSHMATPPGPRGPFPGFPAQPPVVPMAYGNYGINSSVAAQPAAGGPQFQTTGLPGLRPSNVGKYRPHSEDDEEEEEDISTIDEAQAMYREFLDSEQSFTQFYTPDSQLLQDLSHTSRSGIECQPSLTLPPFQPRMSIAPGYFASALRGQSLQYAQASQTPGQVKPTTPGPGFFSTPPTAGVGPAGAASSAGIRIPAAIATGTPLLAVASPPNAVNSVQSPALVAALTGQQRSITTGIVKPDLASTTNGATMGPSTSGSQILFQSKAVLEPRKSKGDLNILFDTVSNRATILMMGETKEILFHHDINKLKMEPSLNPMQVMWSGVKIGSVEQEKVIVSLETTALATQLKEAIQKAAALIQPKGSSEAVSTTPKISSNITATSTPITVATTKSTFALPFGKETGKFTLGGFTFSSPPAIETAADKDKAKVETQKPQPAATKSEEPKPFAGFSLITTPSTSSASSKPDVKFQFTSTMDSAKTVVGGDKMQSPLSNQKPQGTVPKGPGVVAKSPGIAAISQSGAEDEHVEEYEPNIDFKPAIALPELVEKKTGEENETEVFVERCRMFRFDPESKQWKERGVGEIKILKSKDQVKFRIIMRRDQILKLCANHFLNAKMQLTPMAYSDRAWCYFAMDFSEEEIKHEQLAVKFKTPEKAKVFQEKFNDCLRQLREASGAPGVSGAASGPITAKETQDQIAAITSGDAGSSSSDTRSLTDIFKPKADSWECRVCLLRNSGDVAKCPACNTGKPGSAAMPSLSEMFKPKAGSWECQGCFVRNNEDVTACPACGTLKPGVKPELVAKDKPSTSFIFGAKTASGPPETGFKFGAVTTSSVLPTTGGFVFKSTPASTAGTASFQGFKFGATTTSASSTSEPSAGFIFKPSGVTTTAAASATQTKPTSGFFFKPTSAAVQSTTATTTVNSVFKAVTTTTKPSFTIGTSISAPSTVSSTATTTATSAGFNFGAFTFTPGKPGLTTQVTSASGGLLAKLLTSDDSTAEESMGAKPKSSGGFSFTMPPKTSAATESTNATSTSTQSTTGFQFSFTKTPPKSQNAVIVPSSPEVDEHGMYINKEGDDSHIHFEPLVKLPEKFEVKTGEEEEDILFESRGKMYRFVSGEWKEKGVGVVKILKHRGTNKTRILMRRDQVLKICCNHKIEPALSLQPMPRSEGKAWVWYAMDFSEDEGKMEQLALRFRTTETAAEFKKVFDQCRGSATQTSPQKVEVLTQQGQAEATTMKKELFKDIQDETDGTDDVIFVGEDRPSPEQLAKARKYLLPDTFYLYENKPPCRGCIGCNDGEPPADVTAPAKSDDKIPRKSENSKVKESATQNVNVFGAAANIPDLASLTSDGPSDKASGGFLFGSGTSLDFSSLAASGNSGDFTWKIADSSSPFKFAGAGQKLFGASTSAVTGDGDEAEGDESGVVPSDDIHFEPVIPLPELVRVKTGEEDWIPLFCHRAKLYKFDKQVSQWKERGIGDIKLMRHNTKLMFRVLQRREQVLKVSCNHLITSDMKLNPMATSETSWCWVANDLTEGEPTMEQFAAKFKDKDIALEFKRIFERCQEELQQVNSERPVEEPSAASHQVPGNCGTLQHSVSVDIAIRDTIVPSTYTPAGLKQRETVSCLQQKDAQDFQPKANDAFGSEDPHPAMKSTSVTLLGDQGNIYHTKALDVSDADAITPSSYAELGKGKIEPAVTSKSVIPLGDRGNIYHTKALDVSDADTITQSSYAALGKEEVEPAMTSKSVIPLGDQGNIYHTKALDVSDADTITQSSYAALGKEEVEPAVTSTFITPLGDRGNIHHTQVLDVAGKDIIESVNYEPLGDKGNPFHAKTLNVLMQREGTLGLTTEAHEGTIHYPEASELSYGSGLPSLTTAQQSVSQQQEHQAEASNEEEEDGDDEDDDEDDNCSNYKEDEDEVLYEKRVTLSAFEDGQCKKLGMGCLQVTYDEDLNGNSVKFIGDDDVNKCSHIICKEHKVTLNKTTCEWQPIDYSTDEPIRRHFMATFSSSAAAEEFANLFHEGQRLAIDSDISEVVLNEMDAPVIFSRGESGNKD